VFSGVSTLIEQNEYIVCSLDKTKITSLLVLILIVPNNDNGNKSPEYISTILMT